MLDDPMTNEAWSLAAALLSQDGLSTPALLLWRDADDAVKLCRVPPSSSDHDLAKDIITTVDTFVFDHAILISRSFVGLASPKTPPFDPCLDFLGHRHGVSMTFVSRSGDRFMHFAQIVHDDGVYELAPPTPLPPVATALDLLFRGQAPSH